jgi:hypothetical protein
MRRIHEIALWSGALLCVALAGLSSDGAADTVQVRGGANLVTTATPTSNAPNRRTLLARSETIVARDPFRLDRRPPAVQFGAAPAPAPPPSRVQRPALVLTGTFGPPWQGVIEGIPGRQGAVLVREGEALEGFRIQSIRRDSAVVQGSDTTWRLTVRRPW